jgi:glycosyltransferase involved in cell wall biosynthesis
MKTINPKVSVVIPVYGVEKYIERCARSLFEQTLDSLEYIFVNDCTPDASIEIVRKVAAEYPQRQDQIVIINHPTNLGAAKARENGIKAATGEYIIHCDSDDWVDSRMYQTLYEKAKQDRLDYVICNTVFYTDGEHHRTIHDVIPADKYGVIEAILLWKTSTSLCNRLVNSRLYKDDAFVYPTHHMLEDRAYSIQIAYLAKSFGCVETPFYYYLQRADSVCGNRSEAALVRTFQQSSGNMRTIETFFRQQGLLSRYKDALAYCEFNVIGFLMPLLKESNKYRSLFLHTFPNAIRGVWFSKRRSFAQKLICLMICMGVYPSFNRIYSKLRGCTRSV